MEKLSCFKLFGETVPSPVPLFSVPKLEVVAFGFSMSSWWVQDGGPFLLLLSSIILIDY